MPASETGVRANGLGALCGALMPPAGSDGCTLRVGAPWNGGEGS